MIGKAIRIVRTFCMLNIRQLSRLMGVHYSYITQIENGFKTPSMAFLKKLAAGLEIDISVFFNLSECLEKDESGTIGKLKYKMIDAILAMKSENNVK